MEHVHIQDLNVPTKKRDTKMKLLLQTKWVEVHIIAVLDGVVLTYTLITQFLIIGSW